MNFIEKEIERTQSLLDNNDCTLYETESAYQAYIDGLSFALNHISELTHFPFKVDADACIDSAEYSELVTGYLPCDPPTFDEWESSGNADILWSYCLSDISEIPEGSTVVLVRFPNPYGGFDYRFGEVPAEAGVVE